MQLCFVPVLVDCGLIYGFAIMIVADPKQQHLQSQVHLN